MLGSQNVRNELDKMPRKLQCKLVIGSTTVTDVKMLTYSSDWSGNVSIGQVVSSYISATIPTIQNFAGANVTLSMGVGDPVEWTQIGVFRIDEDSVRTRQGYTSFKAYDKLYNLINTYHSTGDKTLLTICGEICSAAGITSPNALTNNTTIDSSMLDGYTLRDILGFIAGYQGKNAYLSSDGSTLQLRWFTSAAYTADGTKANTPYIGENNCSIIRIICQGADGTWSRGSGEGIYFTCPFINEDNYITMLDWLLSSNGGNLGLTYRKAEVDIPYGNFCLQSGDIITVTTVQGQTLSVPIMNNNWNYDGGVSSTVVSYGVSDYQGTANNAERSVSARRFQSVLAEHKAANRVTKEIEYAAQLITGAQGGYVRINYDPQTGYPGAIYVMDQPDIDDALNVWVFNQNGLGHMQRASTAVPFVPADMNLALLMTGTVVAERISGTMISGVGIENEAQVSSMHPKVTLADGAIEFKRVAGQPDGTVSNIGAIKFVPQARAETIDSISIHANLGKAVTIGYDNNGAINDEFIYYSDLSAQNVPSDAAKFNLWGDLRIYNDGRWISLTQLRDDVDRLLNALDTTQ